MVELYRYAAFISYSSKDAAFARRLHGALESYGIPSSLGKFDLIGGGRSNRVYPVFRDREELSAGNLGDQIEANLRASANLIVICSPHGAASPWVGKEIAYFAALGRASKIFTIIPDTAPLVDAEGRDATITCFPAAFRGDALAGDTLEPLAADARRGKDGFRNAWLKLVAGMIGVTPGQIVDRDTRRRRQQRRAFAVTATAISLGALYVTAGIDAQNVRARFTARAEATLNESRALDALPFAIAGAPPQGAILVASPSQTLAKLGALPVRAQLGSVVEHAFSGSGTYLVTLDNGENGVLRDGASGRPILALGKVEGGTPNHFDFSANEAFLAVRSPQGVGTLFQLGGRVQPRNLGDTDTFLFSPDGRKLLTRDRSGVERLWTLGSTDAPLLLGPSESSFASDSQWLYSTTPNKHGWLRSITTTAAPIDLGPSYQFQFGPKFCPDANCLLVLDPTQAATLRMRADNWRPHQIGTVLAYAFSADGRFILVQDGAAHARLYDVRNQQETDLGRLSSRNEASIFSEDGAFLLTQQDNTHGMLWSLRPSVALLRDLGPMLTREFDFGFAPNGGYLLTQDDHRRAILHNTRTAAQTSLGLLWELGYHNFDFSPDSAFLIAKSRTNRGLVWDLRSPTPAPTDIGDVQAFEFSPNGALLISSDAGDRWSLRALATNATPAALGINMEHWEFSPRGERLLTYDAQYRGVLYDTHAWMSASRASAPSATEVCRASGDALAPFASEVRMPSHTGAGTEESAQQRFANASLAADLKGRPWNVCDWRGLLAIFPRENHGQWFEGVRQWLRLISVRLLGSADYRCGEINAAGQSTPSRVAACARARDEAIELARAQGRAN